MKTAIVVVPAAILLAGLAGGVRAFNPQPEPPARFGIVGLARTQSAVLNAVMAVPPPDDSRGGTAPPDDSRAACRVVLGFVDAQGNVFRDEDGDAIMRLVELQGGAAASLWLRSSDVLAPGQHRVPIRAALLPPPDDGGSPGCRGLIATLEIVSPLGHTQILYAPPPDDNSPPPDDQIPPPDDNIPPQDDSVPLPDDQIPPPDDGTPRS